MSSIVITSEVKDLIQSNAPVAVGVSGGKDSCAVAFATFAYLDQVGHTGPRLLIHSDLGRVEWRDSLPTCERLATALGAELVVVRRQAGDLMDRWLTRWRNNVNRYIDLLCVKLILPWSTPSMRFCTSELKTAIICRELVRRFPGQTIVSVSGIRREESPARAKKLVAERQKALTSRTTTGFDWRPILDWKLTEVLGYLQRRQFPLHEAYTIYQSSRVSCAFCVMSSAGDLAAAASCRDNQDLYREMVALEIASTFSFQSDSWLGDVAPHLLGESTLSDLAEAKRKAAEREAAESMIPKHLLYTKGWPTAMPTLDEAILLTRVRQTVARIVGLEINYSGPQAILSRYQELMDLKARKDGRVTGDEDESMAA